MEGFCTLCNLQIESFVGLKDCPRCGEKSVPCTYDDQVDVNINTHELRLLCIWAENWAHSIEEKHPNSPSVAETITGCKSYNGRRV